MSIQFPSMTTATSDRAIPGRSSWGSSPTPRPGLWLGAGLAALCVGFFVGLVLRALDTQQLLFSENGPVEILQTLALIFIAVVLVRTFLRSSDSRALFCLVVAYAVVLAIAREIPRCDSTSYSGGACLTAGWKQAYAIIASGTALVALALAPIAWRQAIRLGNLRWVWPAAVVFVMLALGAASEDLQMWEVEEMIELFAYGYLAAFACSILANTPNPRPLQSSFGR